MKLNTKKFDKNARIEFPGYHEIEKLELVSRDKKKDIRPFVVQFDVFESIWSVGMSGKLVIVDNENMIEDIPIIGEETIIARVKDSIDTHEYKFHVTHISDRSQMKSGMLGYTLHLVSEEMFADSFIRVSKSYIMKTFEADVDDILENFLQSKKERHLAKTDMPRSVIIPNWSPLYACKWLANRSQSEEVKYQNGNFIFYETQSGFYFVSLENLFDSDANEVYCEFEPRPLKKSKNPQTANSDRFALSLLQFEDWKVIKNFDVIENIRTGMYANRMYEFNLTTREIRTENYNYTDNFGNERHLRGINSREGKPVASNDFSPLYFPQAQQRLVLNHKGLFTLEPPDGSGSNIGNWLTEKISQSAQINNMVVTAVLPGHLALEAGMIVNFFVPRAKDIRSTGKLEYDERMSGEWLVTSTHRSFQKDKFWLSIEMIKDCQ
jgi:hypothetical protein